MLAFFFNDTATTEIYTLSLHDALPISYALIVGGIFLGFTKIYSLISFASIPVAIKSIMSLRKEPESIEKIVPAMASRSEEHTSELQSRQYLVCRLLLEKKH